MTRLVPPISIAIGLVVFTFLAISAANFDPEIDGFGRNWKSFSEASFDGHAVLGTPEAVARAGQAWQVAGFKAVLWLGASQLHTISAARDDDRISVVRANEQAAARGDRVRFVQMSFGNGTMHELLGAYLMARELGFKPDAVVLAFVYDDFREVGVRGSIVPRIDDDLEKRGGPGVTQLLAEMTRRDAKAAAAPVQRNAVEGTPQENMERRLTQFLDDHWSGYGNRGRLKGMLEIGWKQFVSRAVLGKERSRSVIVDQEQESYGMSAIDSLRRVVQGDGARLFVYAVPLLNNTGFSYYDEAEYTRFMDGLAGYCSSNGVQFTRLDATVPAPLFGLTNSGLPDYFHFDGEGHSLVAGKVESWVMAGLQP